MEDYLKKNRLRIRKSVNKWIDDNKYYNLTRPLIEAFLYDIIVLGVYMDGIYLIDKPEGFKL